MKNIIETGVIGGLLAGAVKFGWEGLVPPRTPKRDEEPPPVTFMKKCGVSEDLKNFTMTYNENEIAVAPMMIHYSFSVSNAFVYAMVSEKCKFVSFGKGTLYGIIIHLIFHECLLPKLKLTPAREELPQAERFSELVGHIVWMNTIELVRIAIKNHK